MLYHANQGVVNHLKGAHAEVPGRLCHLTRRDHRAPSSRAAAAAAATTRSTSTASASLALNRGACAGGAWRRCPQGRNLEGSELSRHVHDERRAAPGHRVEERRLRRDSHLGTGMGRT